MPRVENDVLVRRAQFGDHPGRPLNNAVSFGGGRVAGRYLLSHGDRLLTQVTLKSSLSQYSVPD